MIMIYPSEITKKWPHRPLSEVVDFLDSKRKPITQKDRVPGPYPYYGANGQQDSVADYIFDEPLVLLAEDGGHFGDADKTIAYQVEGKCWVNNHAHVLRPKKDVDIRYICRHLERYDVTPFITGSTRGKLTKTAANNIPIALPPLEEQRRIAAILDKADGVRRKRKEAIRLTEELLKSTFLEMFGDPVTNPKGWEICELQNVCNRVTDGTHQPPNWADGGIPFLFVSNIVNGEIDFKVSKHITEESWFELTSRCPIEINDILYTTVGSYGNAALVRTKNRFCFQRHIAHIKPDSRSIEPEFLLGMMQSDWIRQQADKQARGVAQKTLNLRELKKFTIFTPPIEEQKKYVKLRQGVEKQLSYYRSALEQSENLFNSLLQRAFRGEL
jgi:type I restriction enzyme S subunit